MANIPQWQIAMGELHIGPSVGITDTSSVVSSSVLVLLFQVNSEAANVYLQRLPVNWIPWPLTILPDETCLLSRNCIFCLSPSGCMQALCSRMFQHPQHRQYVLNHSKITQPWRYLFNQEAEALVGVDELIRGPVQVPEGLVRSVHRGEHGYEEGDHRQQPLVRVLW